MIQLSLYIAGRCRLCESVPPALMFRTLQAISDRMPELSARGRVMVTAEDGGVTYIIPLEQ